MEVDRGNSCLVREKLISESNHLRPCGNQSSAKRKGRGENEMSEMGLVNGLAPLVGLAKDPAFYRKRQARARTGLECIVGVIEARSGIGFCVGDG